MNSYNFTRVFLHGNARTVVLKKNMLGSLFIKGCSIIIQLILVPLTLGFLSSELYGVWLTLSSIVLWLNFFDVGFTTGLKNKLTEAIALEQWERGKSLVSTTYFMLIIIFVPLCIILEILVPIINWSSLLNVQECYNPQIKDAAYILIACFCLNMITHVLSAVVAAYQKVALSSSFAVIGQAFSIVIIYFLTKFCPPSLVALASTISVLPIIIFTVASIILYKGKFKRVAPDFKMVNTHQIKDLFSLGAKFFIIQIQFIIMTQMTNFLISNLSGPDQVTTYNISHKYISVALLLYNVILAPLWPAFTDAYTKHDYTWMKNIYNKMIKLFGITAVLIIIMTVISPFIYSIWIGNRVSVPIQMTILVGIYTIIHSCDSLQIMVINGIGCVKLQTYVTAIGMLLHIPLSFMIGKYLNFGAYGVIISMIIVTLMYLFIFTFQVRLLINNKAHGLWGE